MFVGLTASRAEIVLIVFCLHEQFIYLTSEISTRESKMVSRMSQLLIVALAVLLVCSLADATYRKPPFNGSIFGKRASQAGRPYSIPIQSIPLLIVIQVGEWFILVRVTTPRGLESKLGLGYRKTSVVTSVCFLVLSNEKLNYTHQLRAEFKIKLNEPVFTYY